MDIFLKSNCVCQNIFGRCVCRFNTIENVLEHTLEMNGHDRAMFSFTA